MSECCANLVGVLSGGSSLIGVLSSEGTLRGFLELPAETSPIYTGTYDVTPIAHQGTLLDTNGKRMTDDVRVSEIPYYLTSNLSGGYTAIIG